MSSKGLPRRRPVVRARPRDRAGHVGELQADVPAGVPSPTKAPDGSATKDIRPASVTWKGPRGRAAGLGDRSRGRVDVVDGEMTFHGAGRPARVSVVCGAIAATAASIRPSSTSAPAASAGREGPPEQPAVERLRAVGVGRLQIGPAGRALRVRVGVSSCRSPQRWAGCFSGRAAAGERGEALEGVGVGAGLDLGAERAALAAARDDRRRRSRGRSRRPRRRRGPAGRWPARSPRRG